MSTFIKNLRHKLLFAACIILCLASFKGVSVYADTLPEDYTPIITNVSADKSTYYISIDWSVKNSDYEYFMIYRSITPDGEYDYYDTVYTTHFTDYNPYTQVTYYYKIVTVKYDDNYEDVYSEPAFAHATIPLNTTYIKSVKPVKSHGLQITFSISDDAEGYGLYRSDAPNGTYTLIKSIKNDHYYFYDFTTELSFTDKNLTVGKTYYYKVRPYVTYLDTTYYGSFSGYKYGQATIDATRITKAVSKKKSTNTLTWKKLSDADGYIVYYSTKYNRKYKKLKTISNKNTTSLTHKKLKNGVAYFYKVYGYKKLSEKNLMSVEPSIYEKYCDYFTYANESYESRIHRLFGNSKNTWYSTASKAGKNMKEVKIKVWDVNSKGKKFTRTFYVRVHKNLAPSVKQMFKEIYKSKERFPIHDIGCYNWRGKGSASEHCIGTAFDINSNENYMIDNGQVLAGSFWRPKKSRYSIPLKCKLVSILNKYGFSRGFWGNRKDYMHFSYLGT